MILILITLVTMGLVCGILKFLVQIANYLFHINVLLSYYLIVLHLIGSNHKFQKAYDKLDYLILHPEESMAVYNPTYQHGMLLDVDRARVSYATPTMNRKAMTMNAQRQRMNSDASILAITGSDTESEDELLNSQTSSSHKQKKQMKFNQPI